jgi:hypothetical protein
VPGYHADLTALSLDRPNMTPFSTPPPRRSTPPPGRGGPDHGWRPGRLPRRPVPDLDYPALAAEVRDMARRLARIVLDKTGQMNKRPVFHTNTVDAARALFRRNPPCPPRPSSSTASNAIPSSRNAKAASAPRKSTA